MLIGLLKPGLRLDLMNLISTHKTLAAKRLIFIKY